MNRDDNYLATSYGDYLAHHGILGMKWGVRRTPEQLGHIVAKKRKQFDLYAEKSKLAGEAGKTRAHERYKKKAQRAYRAEVKLNSKFEKALKKQVEDDDRIVQKGSVDDVLAISDRLSDDQINRAVHRIQNRQKLEGLKADDGKKLDKLVGVGKKVADISGSVYSISNNIRQFRKAMSDMQMDEIKNEEKEREKELSGITKKADLSEVWKVKDELSNTQMKDVYERLYLNNKKHVDRAIRENDEKKMKEYTHLLAYSPLYNKKSDKRSDDDEKK